MPAPSRMPAADEFAALGADRALARAAMGLWDALDLMARDGALGPVELDLSRPDRPRLRVAAPEGTPGQVSVVLSRE